MTKVLAFVGPHNSGKTTLIKRIVKELSQKDLSVAVIKSTKHKGLFEEKGKDTTVFLNLPVSKVILVAPDKVAVFQKDLSIEEIIADAQDDIVICEGFKSSFLPKIAVFKEYNNDYWRRITNIVAVVSQEVVNPWNVPHFNFNEIEKIAAFIINHIPSLEEEKVKLYVNGKKIEIKPFIQRILKDSILGFVKNLKGAESPKRIRIEIETTE